MDNRSSPLFWYPGHELILTDIVRAENCHLYDSSGKKYVDLESGVWCMSLGQGNARIRRVIAQQGAQIGHTGFNYSCPVVEETAREILALLGFDDGKCVFLCSGSEAVEYSVRVAQTIISRPLMMTMADSYFGAYGSANRRHADEWFSFDWFPCSNCPESRECDQRCERWAAVPWDKIGGFLFEPGSSSGLVRFPPDKLIRNIAVAMRQADGLFLVNEVTTGLGRTGAWFGYQHYGITPDIVGMGKGIGNGYPVAVVAVAAHVADRLGTEPIKYAQSHQNDPVGAAVAREVIRIIREEHLLERGRELGAALTSELNQMREQVGRIKDVRSRGLMLAIELVDDENKAFTIRTHRELVRRGFVVGRRPGTSVLRLDPSLTIAREDIERFLVVLKEVLSEA